MRWILLMAELIEQGYTCSFRKFAEFEKTVDTFGRLPYISIL